jgi:hypothetical protein
MSDTMILGRGYTLAETEKRPCAEILYEQNEEN